MSEIQVQLQQGWPDSLEETAAFLDRNWAYDSIWPDLLAEKLTGDPCADPELCLTAFAGDKMAGFIFCVRRTIRGQEFGYVKLMAVEQTWRRQKIGTRLYAEAEKRLMEKGAEVLRWYDVPMNYFMPGIDPRYTPAYCFALKQGYSCFGEAINMLCDLDGKDFSTKAAEIDLEAKGVEVRRASQKDQQAILQLLSVEWALWNNEVRMAMCDDPPSVHIAIQNEEVKAFSVHNGNNKGTGWFGPMGTHPDLRGFGMGTVLLKRCLKDMQAQGHRQAIIPWVAPIAFYSHFVDAHIDRVFWRMEKEIQ
ncbi:MAG: GNAT family N-acetyltransferase [Bacteroidales bacterium]